MTNPPWVRGHVVPSRRWSRSDLRSPNSDLPPCPIRTREFRINRLLRRCGYLTVPGLPPPRWVIRLLFQAWNAFLCRVSPTHGIAVFNHLTRVSLLERYRRALPPIA